MIWKLLRRNISAWQLAGYGVSVFVGLVIVTLAVQLHADLSAAMSPEAGPQSRLTISRRVSAGDTFRGSAPTLSDADLAELAAQPWVADMAPLRAADFPVHAAVSLGGRQMSTALFFESLPARFLDVDTARWHFDPAAPMVPVVIPRDYLTLYNFGFAASGGMPAVSEGMLSALPLTVAIGRDGALLPARIVGYSDRLNTIAVPEDFMEWASARYGTGESRRPSRVVVLTSRPGDPAVDRWLDARGYSTGASGADADRASHLLTLVTGAVAAVGGAITLMALGILLLSLYLLVTKNRRAISGLLMLGYTPGRVSRSYIALVAALNCAVLAAVLVAAAVLRPLWTSPLATLGIGASSPAAGVAVAVGVMVALTALDALVLRSLVRRCFR